MSRSRPVILIAAILIWQTEMRAGPVPEPPLPGEEGPVTPVEAFSILPAPGEIPPESIAPGEPDPVQPPPVIPAMDQLPDIEPLGLPSDGEPMPDLPPVPGLVLPGRTPPRPGVAPSAPDLLPDLLPTPELQLATKSMWYRSPHQARKAAVAEGKPLLIFFAQMWGETCGSALLNDDLLAMPEFNEFASAKLILTKLQYPVGTGGGIGEAKLAALQQFKDYFKITGFPVIVVIDETGRELERIKGYRRVKQPGSDVEYSSGHVLLARLKEAEHRHSERRRYRQERIDKLTAQGYRLWTSRAGSTMMGKLVDAKPQRVILMDENGQWRQVLPAQLTLFDAEWARRKHAGTLPGSPPKKETADSGAALSSQP
jgi:hypothetical protein